MANLPTKHLSGFNLTPPAHGWGWLALGFAGVGLFNLLPIVGSLWLSFCQWDMVTAPPQWVGLSNYTQLLAHPQFWHNTWVTVCFVVLSVGLELGLGFALAYGLFVVGQRWAWLRLLYFVPFITPMVSMALVWGWLYEPQGGLLNTALQAVGLAGQPWLFQPQTALLALVVFRVWKQLGYSVLLLGAGLSSLPDELMDASRMDGTGPWQTVRHVVLPHVWPVLGLVATTSIIQAFQAFDVVYLLTQGGPNHHTEVLVYRVFKLAFEQFQVGKASALAYILFAMVLGVCLLQQQFKQRTTPTK
jgi:multiple sugar transport system permease protein